MGNIFSLALILAAGFAWGMLAALSCNYWGPFAYLSAVKVLVWDYSSITLVYNALCQHSHGCRLCDQACVVFRAQQWKPSASQMAGAGYGNSKSVVESRCRLVMLRTKMSMRHNACESAGTKVNIINATHSLRKCFWEGSTCDSALL